MDKQNLMPQAAQPVNRITTGQLPESLAELSEEALKLHGDVDSNSSFVLISTSRCAHNLLPSHCDVGRCSYDGDDAE